MIIEGFQKDWTKAAVHLIIGEDQFSPELLSFHMTNCAPVEHVPYQEVQIPFPLGGVVQFDDTVQMLKDASSFEMQTQT